LAERLEDWVHVHGARELLSRDQARTAGKATMAELPVNPWLVPVAHGE